MHHKLLLLFLLGGFLFSGVYYLSTTLKNPALAALLSLLPLSVLCAYVLPNQKIFNIYTKNALVVISINFFVLLTMFLIALNTSINYIYIIIFGLIFWSILQYSKYMLLEKYLPGFQTYKK